jgi:hypothetical protein
MRAILALTVASLCGSWFAPAPAVAQVQLNVCGVPPLPPCERPRPRVQERVIIERDRGGDFGTLCRTRTLRCEKDRPRPIGDRCTCEDEDGERIVGRIVR